MTSNYYSTRVTHNYASGLFIDSSFHLKILDETNLNDLEYKDNIVYEDCNYVAKLECLICFTKWDGYRNMLSYKCPFCGNKVEFEKK